MHSSTVNHLKLLEGAQGMQERRLGAEREWRTIGLCDRKQTPS
jgi:hypothetical protein